MVYKLVPELFSHEINKLGYADRKRFKKPRISYARADGEYLEVDQDVGLNRLTELEKLFDKSLQMEMYLYEQANDVFEMYEK